MIGTFIGGLMLGLVPTYVLLPLLAATFIAPYAAPGLITALGTVGPLAAQALVAGGIISDDQYATTYGNLLRVNLSGCRYNKSTLIMIFIIQLYSY